MWSHTVGVIEAFAVIVGGFSIPVGFAIRWTNKHVAQPLKEVPTLVRDVGELRHTLTVNGNTSDPPTILDRLQNVEKLGAHLAKGQRDITLHLGRQDKTADEVASALHNNA